VPSRGSDLLHLGLAANQFFSFSFSTFDNLIFGKDYHCQEGLRIFDSFCHENYYISAGFESTPK
jgi:hypothetical protein